ncbi:urease accessory protein UreE [Paracoccus nototheniae]|uniref:Urease accessory protein UreE n=1 Tax=Paracoccus nototheniae TaxID=2489002 RepID=A0ABW4DQN8_9RHOB|nr:urease accessory protein UreE [Paracoccus nototheniae]
MTGDPLILTAILGHAGDGAWHDRLHAMEHQGRVEVLTIPATEAARKRMRLRSDRGRDCAIALARDQGLTDGAVLYCDDDLAILARVDGAARLRLEPATVADALRLGHWCGNLHWKVDFHPDAMEIVLDGPPDPYLDRLRDLQGLAQVRIVMPGHAG